MKKILTLLILAFVLMQSCTKVDENIYDKYAAEDFYSSPSGSDVALASVYAQIAGNWGGNGYAGADNGLYDLNSFASDEQRSAAGPGDLERGPNRRRSQRQHRSGSLPNRNRSPFDHRRKSG